MEVVKERPGQGGGREADPVSQRKKVRDSRVGGPEGGPNASSIIFKKSHRRETGRKWGWEQGSREGPMLQRGVLGNDFKHLNTC